MELAVKCLSLALRSFFQYRVSCLIHDRQNQAGLVCMQTMEQIAAYMEAHPDFVDEY